MLYICI